MIHRSTSSSLALALALTLTPALVHAADAKAHKSTATPKPAAKPAPAPQPAAPKPVKLGHSYPTFGQVERLDPLIDQLIPADAKIEKLAEGFSWAEGPVWRRRDYSLLFSDVPRNTVFRWKAGAGTAEFLRPSGYTGTTARGGEPGSNGLTIDSAGRLVLCEHGDRRVTRLEKNGTKTVLAEFYKGRRLNSPNDLVLNRKGDVYFTDPPYGLEKGNTDPRKELIFNGVFLRRANGQLVLLTDKLTYPNGIALSPDEKTLYVAVSDEKQPVIMCYGIKADGTLGAGRVFFDASSLTNGRKGMPDGLKVDRKGNLFATGPGGVLVISPSGKHLGTINTGEATANCAFGGEDGSTLYITANMFLARIRTSTKGSNY